MPSLSVSNLLAALLVLICPINGVLSQCFTDNDGNGTPCSMSTERFVNGTVDFAVAFYKTISLQKNGSGDNVFISPFSVHSALTITYIGSKDNTKAELEKALHLGSTNQKLVINTYQKYKDGLLHNATEQANYTFSAANRLYFDQSQQLRQCITASLNDEVEQLNFAQSPDPSRVVINQWVESQTNNLIKDLLPPGLITSYTRLVVVNAAYFKGFWLRQFDQRATTKQDFFLGSGTTIQVDTMYQDRERYLYTRDTTLRCSAIELPYLGNKMSMVILLPDQNDRVEDLVARISSQNLNNLYARLTSTLVNLWLPKFKIEQSMALIPPLESLGIKDLFQERVADLSGFTGSGGLFVSAVQHKTYVAVQETGTEAAAATAVVISLTSIAVGNPVEFKTNRPFVFFIRDKESNSILFIGTMQDPSKNK